MSDKDTSGSQSSGLGDITLWKTCDICHKSEDMCQCDTLGGDEEVEVGGSGADLAELKRTRNVADLWQDPGSELAAEAEQVHVELAPGELVGANHQVIRCLGSGGMSSVYLARNVHTNELCALKMLNNEISLHEEARQRFEREARAMKRLDHPNLLTLKDFGKSSDGSTFFIMDFLNGRSLAQELILNRVLDPVRACRIFVQVCAAMQHAHQAGVVHRDIKPGNIFLTQKIGKTSQNEVIEDYVKVLDFGIAKLSISSEDTETNLTQKGQVLGSPRYMSPEQCLGGKLDQRSDIYSLGCVMYQALTGQTPFNGEHSLAILFKQVNEEPQGIGNINTSEQMRKELEVCVLKCLAKAPADRFDSMGALAADLKQFIV